MNKNIFSNQTFLELIDCLFLFVWIEKMMQNDLMIGDFPYQKE